MTDTQMQFFFFPSLGRRKMKCFFMDVNDKNLNYDLKQSNLHTPVLYSLIHLRDRCRKYCSWKLVMSACGARRKKKKEKHQRYNRMCSAWSRPLLPRWQCDSWQFDLDLERCPVLCVNVWFVCVYVHEHVLKCTYLYICKYVHIIIGLCFFCAGGMRENFLCAVV